MIKEAFVKIIPILVSFTFLTFWHAVALSLAFILLRRYVVASLFGLEVMDGMDSATF